MNMQTSSHLSSQITINFGLFVILWTFSARGVLGPDIRLSLLSDGLGLPFLDFGLVFVKVFLRQIVCQLFPLDILAVDLHAFFVCLVVGALLIHCYWDHGRENEEEVPLRHIVNRRKASNCSIFATEHQIDFHF